MAAGSNPSSAFSAPRDRFPFHGEKTQTRTGALLKGTGGVEEGEDGTGPGRAGPFLPPRYRSIPLQSGWTSPEPHGASRSLTELQQQRVWSPTGGEGGHAQPHALCPHALTAQRRDSRGRVRSGDGSDGQRERSGPLRMLLSGHRTERGLTAEDLSATLPGGPSGAAAIHVIARAHLLFVQRRRSRTTNRYTGGCSTRSDR